MAKRILVDLDRCIGCWTCSMICKTCHHLDDDDFRVTVRTNGNGSFIDRPQGQYPNLKMRWMPIYSKACTFCADGSHDGTPWCVSQCPCGALSYGDPNDPESEFSKALADDKARGKHVFELPAYENTQKHIVYSTRG